MDHLTPETARFLMRLTIGLVVFAGVLAIAAFGLGIAREGIARWPILLAGILFLLSPLAVRLLLR